MKQKSPGHSRKIPFLLALFLILSACENVPPTQPVYESHFLAFGTLVDLSISGTTQEHADRATRAIEQDFLRLHREWHAWEEGTLQLVNHQLQQQQTFTAPPVILPLISLSRSLSIASDHLFNPSIGYLIEAWGFHSDDPTDHRPPPPETLQRLLRANPRMSDIQINGTELHSTNSSVKLDFGAIGKGYGINLAVERLKKMGIKNAIVNAGGDIRAFGSRHGTPWRIGIRNPTGIGVLASIEISGDESVFTSGDYERNFSYQGKRYHHIIDPRTGYPAQGTSSVTVIHRDAAVADAAATALFIAGPELWYPIAQKMKLEYVLLVDSSAKLHMNPAMQKRLKLLVAEPVIQISAQLGYDKTVE